MAVIRLLGPSLRAASILPAGPAMLCGGKGTNRSRGMDSSEAEPRAGASGGSDGCLGAPGGLVTPSASEPEPGPLSSPVVVHLHAGHHRRADLLPSDQSLPTALAEKRARAADRRPSFRRVVGGAILS